MKYLALREFDNVTNTLNFDTADCHVIGACELYTVKAGKSDKKLYKEINESLETQHEMLVRLSKSLSPPQAELFSFSLSRPSPFGSLTEVASRRAFAYLIATLNASHPDYEFSNNTRPSDFRREKSLRAVMNTIDETIHNLRPRNTGFTTLGPSGWTSKSAQTFLQNVIAPAWGPKTWAMIDKEMTLRQCEIYLYSPDDDPFDGEENALWSLNYFFYNKDKKRVCYLYLRGLSISSHSPPLPSAPATPIRKRPQSFSRQTSTSAGELGSSKRTKHWLGEDADEFLARSGDQDRDVITFEYPGDDEVDADVMLGPSDSSSRDYSIGSEDDEEMEVIYRQQSAVRGVSEEIMERMEV